MEDRDKSKATKAENIVELTPDMEVTDESQLDIIELTDIVDGPDEVVPLAPPVTASPPENDKTDSRPPRGSAISSAIEEQVEAAFDFVQSPISEAPPEEKPSVDDEGLMDRLSDIPQMVDDALDASGAPDADESVQQKDPPGLETGAHGDSTAQDAARSEFKLDEEDDEIIELTDIVDPSELQARDVDDDEVIELTDIVDIRELEEAGLPMDEDDEIIELTDIVDPAELRVGAVSTEQDDTGTGGEVDAAPEDQEYEDLLEMIDTLDPEDLLVDLAEEGPETDSGDEDAEITAAPAVETAEPEIGAPDEDQDYEDLLETIDSLDPEDLLVSVDEAGLLDAGDGDGPAVEQAAEEDGLLTLTEVLNRDAAEREDNPPADSAGKLTREVEKETGREVRTLTDQEIEAAVERILKTKYADTIERLIANAVEKAVTREIENLKRTMLDDDEPA